MRPTIRMRPEQLPPFEPSRPNPMHTSYSVIDRERAEYRDVERVLRTLLADDDFAVLKR